MKTAATDRSTLRLLPAGRKGTQKVVVGDTDGVLQSFKLSLNPSMSSTSSTSAMLGTQSVSSKVTSVFKTLPAPDYPVAHVRLGFSVERSSQQPAAASVHLRNDKIFVVSGEGNVRGFTKKGKEFFKIEATSMNERTVVAEVATPQVLLAGEYMLSEWNQSKETSFWMSPDKIHDVLALSSVRALVACHDRTIRCLEHGSPIYEISTEGACTSLSYSLPSSVPSASRNNVMYATAQGDVRHLEYSAEYHVYRKGWIIASAAGPASRSSISGFDMADMSQDGTGDVVLGYDDGSIQVYSFDVDVGDPLLAFSSRSQPSRQLDESITSLSVGCFSSKDLSHRDIIVATYSGRILVFSTRSVLTSDSDAPSSAHASEKSSSKDLAAAAAEREKERDREAKERESTIKALRIELDRLREDVSKKREKASRRQVGGVQMSMGQLKMKLSHKFELDAVSSTYGLTVESDLPISQLVLRSSSRRLELDPLFRNGLAGNDSAVLSETVMYRDDQSAAGFDYVSGERKVPQPVAEGSLLSYLEDRQRQVGGLVCSVRLQSTSSYRAQVQFRLAEETDVSANETDSVLQVFVVPHGEPRTAERIDIPIYALGLHERVLPDKTSTQKYRLAIGSHVSFEEFERHLEANAAILRISSDISLDEIYSVFASVLPGFPIRPPSSVADSIKEETSQMYIFQSTFLHTAVRIRISGIGSNCDVAVTSDNVNSLMLIRAVFSRLAVRRKMRLEFAFDNLTEANFEYLARVIDPLLQEQCSLAKKVQLLSALEELVGHEASASETSNNTPSGPANASMPTFLSRDHADILQKGSELRTRFATQPQRWTFLAEVVDALLVNRGRWKGKSNVDPLVRQEMWRVLQPESYSTDSLLHLLRRLA
jgi:hypothetical protein